MKTFGACTDGHNYAFGTCTDDIRIMSFIRQRKVDKPQPYHEQKL